jgi:hypothetical protein
MANPWELQYTQQPAAGPAPQQMPWEMNYGAPVQITVNPKPKQPFELVNIDAPIEQFRTEVAALPEQQRVWAMQRWADAQEAKIAPTRGYIGPAMRSIAQGTPIGTYGDEINATVNSYLPEALGGRPYEETLALERARDRRVEKENFGPDLLGNVVGGIITAPVRGAVALKDAALAGIQGFGRGDTFGERAINAGTQAVASGAMSLLGRGVGSAYNRWTRQTPGVAEAGARQGLDLPFYATAQSPQVQGAGRQAAQAGDKTPWTSIGQRVDDRAGQIVQQSTGVAPELAPAVVGANVRGGFEQAGQGAGRASGALAEQTSSMIPPGMRFQLPGMRQEVGEAVGRRFEEGLTNPQAGMGDLINLVTRPEGVTYPGMARRMTTLGQEVHSPNPFVPREVPTADLAQIYRAGRQVDQPNMIREALRPQPPGPYTGPWGAEAAVRRFQDNLPVQGALHEFQDEIGKAVGSKSPEKLVQMALNAAQVGGGKTGNREVLDLIAQSLSPQQREQLGAAAFAHISNQARMPGGGTSYAQIAKQIGSIPPAVRAQMFPGQVGRDVEDMLTVASRLHQVEGMAHRGSAATMGEAAKSFGTWGPAVGAAAAGAANYAGMAPEVTGALAVLGGARAVGKMGAQAVRPTLLQHGLPLPAIPQGVDNWASRGWGGASRAVPNEWWASP